MFLVRAEARSSSLPGLPAQICVLAAGGGQGAVCSDSTLVLNYVEFIRHAPEQLAWLSVDEMSMLSPASPELTMVVTQAWAGDSLSELPSWVNQSSFGP